MILYTPGDRPAYCPRFYFNYGEMIFSQIMAGHSEPTDPTEATFTPYNDYIQEAYTTTDADDETNFFKFLTPYALAVVPSWPVPIYGNANKTERKLLIEFLCHYLFPKYWESYLLPWGEEDTAAEKERVYKRFFDRFLEVLTSTFGKYIPIIKAYKAKEANLLARLGSQTENLTRFNDTPQEGGDYSDEQHTTTATTATTTTESDFETPINRLKEIRDNWENLYNAWALDFDILFTKGESLDDE